MTSRTLTLSSLPFVSLSVGSWLSLAAACLLLVGCDPDPDAPIIDSISPGFAPAETLVIIEGQHLAEIEQLRLDDQIINFNTAYNADNALLFRVPTNVDPREYTLSLTTAGGTASVPFRVALDAPQIFSLSRTRGPIGSEVTLRGENFFEPLEVFFPMGMEDSVQAEILTFSEDSLVVNVPEGASAGNIVLLANGGRTISPSRFLVTSEVLIADFDGNGLRSDVSLWRFTSGLDQTAEDAVRSDDPSPVDGNFLKLSGIDTRGSGLIGSATTPTNDEGFTGFNLTTPTSSTLLEFDVNTNGHPATRIIIVVREIDGSRNDFTRELALDDAGWVRVSQPLVRFNDLNGAPPDAAKVGSVRFLLFDTERSGEQFEVNIDNLAFSEVL